MASISAIPRSWRARCAGRAVPSVWARLDAPPVAARCLQLIIRRGLVATCAIVDLGVSYSPRLPESYAATRADRALALELLAIDQAVLDRAVDVQAVLAEQGEHRAASLPDLVVAATCERAEVTVLRVAGRSTGSIGVTRVPVGSLSAHPQRALP